MFGSDVRIIWRYVIYCSTLWIGNETRTDIVFVLFVWKSIALLIVIDFIVLLYRYLARELLFVQNDKHKHTQIGSLYVFRVY